MDLGDQEGIRLSYFKCSVDCLFQKMQASSFEQLPLGIKLRDSASFDNFYSAKETEVIGSLRSLVQGERQHRLLWLWGPQGSGKTHLLQAACRFATESGIRSLYLPLGLSRLTPLAIEDTGLAELICIDDLHCVSGDPDWEKAFFSLYELLMHGNGRLVLSANAPPKHLNLTLPDLATRFASQLVYRVPELDDDGKSQAIQLRAAGRGFLIPDEVLQYILHHFSRNTSRLFELLDHIDRSSLATQRRVTIPFVKGLTKDF